MKILFIADVSIGGIIGGAERVLYEQTTRLARRGHQVHILTRKLSMHKKDHTIISDVCEWRYECNSKNNLTLFLSTLRNGRKLFERLCKKYSYDCINFHQPFTAFAVLRSSHAKNISKIYTCHSLSYEEFISRNRSKKSYIKRELTLLQIFMRKWIEKKCLKLSDKIVVLSRFTKEKIKDSYNILSNKIEIINGGVDLKRFQLSPNAVKLREKTGIPKNKIVLFTLRNLVDRMGLENLILAVHKLVSSSKKIYLIIGGDGPLKSDLIALSNRLGVEDSIRFQGYIREDRLPSFYQMADLFVLPTKELEGFGLVTLEALASGLPVVGTPVGGTKEILGDFNVSFLFKGTDPDSMYELIVEKCRFIEQHPLKWKQISFRCRKYVEQNFSWDKNVNSLEDLLLNTLPN